jgi:hypothetical protein
MERLRTEAFGVIEGDGTRSRRQRRSESGGGHGSRRRSQVKAHTANGADHARYAAVDIHASTAD